MQLCVPLSLQRLAVPPVSLLFLPGQLSYALFLPAGYPLPMPAGNLPVPSGQKEDRLYDTLHGHNLPSLHGGTGRHKERHHIGRSPLLSQPGNGSHCNGSRYWQTTEVVYTPHTHAPGHDNYRYGRYKKQHIREEYRNGPSDRHGYGSRAGKLR